MINRPAAIKALVVTQSRWRDELRASATKRIGVTTVRSGGGGALEKHTSEYIREQELASWLKDVAKRVKRAVRLHLTESVMWMPHQERQHVVRELAMSGVGEDLYDPQSPLVHAVEAALRFDPQWHVSGMTQMYARVVIYNRTGMCCWNLKLVATWVDCGTAIDRVAQRAEEALKNSSCDDVVEQKLRALTGTYRHKGVTKHLCRAANKVNSSFTPMFMGSCESFLKYLIDKNNPPVNKPLVWEPWMPPLPAVTVQSALKLAAAWSMTGVQAVQ